MKRLSALLIVLVVLSMISCASIPAPEGAEDSLVVGSFIIAFPDGFFNRPSRTFSSDIKLNFKNTTTGRKFSVFIMNGFFYFLSNGSDEYQLESFEYASYEYGPRYSFGGPLHIEFSALPKKVLYMGAMTFNYRNPKRTNIVEAGKPVDYWHFDKTLDRTWDQEKAIEFLSSQDPETPWLTYEVERVQPE